ncbi:hypothetical protein HELRODRAFT_64539 [Helobdella robusta]|uniref:Sodium channel protein n=1 Tax=Helobdella robusta TaxID=6412 RepID=T1FXW1_HELRO|nr:hypothetical protein HELRODRAFT_64539 [Helobdella robusta]ESO06390.1 hypothetical protein HELRODRAFT_64539 [Helobdella robusta]
MSFQSLGNASALRTFRVLRTLKTVAVVPGLKTIVGALMEAVRRLRDVMILSLFVLSIFALIGLQLYSGLLTRKCIKLYKELGIANSTNETFIQQYVNNESNWIMTPDGSKPLLCGGGECPANTSCVQTDTNPDLGYTSFDNFGWAMLCAFRLMTQDFWENLYQQVIRAHGKGNMLFFIFVIFFASFYLVNVILAIVAMAYDDCRRQDQLDAEEAEAEQAEWEDAQEECEEEEEDGGDGKDGGQEDVDEGVGDHHSQNDENNLNSSQTNVTNNCNNTSYKKLTRQFSRFLSLPETPTTSTVVQPTSLLNSHLRSSQFSWLKADLKSIPPLKFPRFTLHPCLFNLDLPFADDSTAVTPSSDLLVNLLNQLETQYIQQQESYGSPKSRFNSVVRQRNSPLVRQKNVQPVTTPKPSEPTHFHWKRNMKTRKIEAETERRTSLKPWVKQKENYFLDNPFVMPSPTASLDMKDVIILKNLLKSASGKKKKKGCYDFLRMEKDETKTEYAKRKLLQVLFDWECHPHWYKFAHIIELFIMDAFVDLFITLCIVVNTIFMAIEHDEMGSTLENILKFGNYIFTGIFTVEAVLKVLALGLYRYLQDKWSCFDFIIVILSLVELGLQNFKGLSILRSFRLLRVFKLAKSWPTLNLLIGIIGRTMGALGNLCFVLAIIIFIFAVVGMQLFGPNYNEKYFPEVVVMRWHFKDFFHSFMIVFRILCGEWIENMWNCIHCSGYHCIVFFILTMIIGNLVLLNLFLALLLSSFGAESLKKSQEDEGVNKLVEAIDRIDRFFKNINRNHMKTNLANQCNNKNNFVVTVSPAPSDSSCDCEGLQDDAADNDYGDLNKMVSISKWKYADPPKYHSDDNPNNDEYDDARHEGSSYLAISTQSLDRSDHLSQSQLSLDCQQNSQTHNQKHHRHHHLNSSSRHHDNEISGSFMSLDQYYTSKAEQMPKELYATRNRVIFHDLPAKVNVIYIKYPDDCCPQKCAPIWRGLHQSILGQIWWKCRCYSYSLVEHTYFETFIIIMILASSLALAVEDRNMDNKSYDNVKYILKILDKSFTVIFVFEMALKMTAYGFKRYFTDAWCWLDFIIVAISLVSWGAEGAGAANMGAFRALRTLRALRPLRAVSRWEGMKVVVNALIQAIPSILNVLLVCLVFWLIFSIMGVNLFMGKFGRCVDADGVKIEIDTLNKFNINIGHNMSWFNPKVNFDNVLLGYLALFQVATFKGWMDIMYAAIDSREYGQQPKFEEKHLMYLYFVMFIVFGSFFTMNLFIGVIIEQFNMQKKKITGGSLEMLMTEDQKKYYNAMKKLGSKQPTKPVPKPRFAFQMFFYKLTKNQKFDIAIMFVILLNMMSMAVEHYKQPDIFSSALHRINTVFITIFTLECVMKLLGFRLYYFKEPWNIFDFVVVIVSLLAMFIQDSVQKISLSPTILRVVRVFRVGRVLRLVKSAKGIRTLLFSLAVSMPALFNIALLLFLIMFIYAIVGMSCFMYVKHTAGIDDMFNFETFANSMIILFQTCTSAGWDGILAGLMNDSPPDCSNKPTEFTPNGDCGNSALGIGYLCSYLVITYLVVINMYIAVILENFSQATEDVQQGLTQDDFDMYYELWEKYDEKATQYIPLSQLSEFVDALEDPLRIPNPNFYKLVQMDIPICEGDTVNCVDILDALTKNFLGTKDDAAEGLGDLKGPGRINYHPIGSTLKRQREIFTVKIIQRTWRNFVKRKKELSSNVNRTSEIDSMHDNVIRDNDEDNSEKDNNFDNNDDQKNEVRDHDTKNDINTFDVGDFLSQSSNESHDKYKTKLTRATVECDVEVHCDENFVKSSAIRRSKESL